MIKCYESLLLYEKSISVILEAIYSSRIIKVLRPYLNVTREAVAPATHKKTILSKSCWSWLPEQYDTNQIKQ